MEESDILRRATIFLDSVKPDPQYCLLPGETRKPPVVSATSTADHMRDLDFGSFSQSLRSAGSLPAYVVNSQSYLLFKDNRFRATLPVGSYKTYYFCFF